MTGSVRTARTDPVAGGSLRSLPREALVVWQLENLLGTAAVAAVLVFVSTGPFSPDGWRSWAATLLLLTVVLGSVEGLLVVPRRHAWYRYALRDDCVVVVRGRLWLRETVFPLRQVLYVETRQGPVMRRYGLSTVRLGTIAESHAVGPLPTRVAEEFRAVVDARGAGG